MAEVCRPRPVAVAAVTKQRPQQTANDCRSTKPSIPKNENNVRESERVPCIGASFFFGKVATMPTTTAAAATTTASAAAWAWWQSLGSPRFVCAPMVWQSETAFRRMVTDLGGCTLAYTPMMHADQLLQNNDAAKGHLADLQLDMAHHRSYPLIGQLCSTDPAEFVRAARIVEPYVDAIDLNLGCPQRTAQLGGFGAFLMERPDTVAAMVRRASTELGKPVCCKIRVFESVERTVAFAQLLEKSGCSLLAVHARTRAQRHHEGAPHYATIRAVVEAVSIPVIANGGVCNRREALGVIASTGAVASLTAALAI